MNSGLNLYALKRVFLNFITLLQSASAEVQLEAVMGQQALRGAVTHTWTQRVANGTLSDHYKLNVHSTSTLSRHR